MSEEFLERFSLEVRQFRKDCEHLLERIEEFKIEKAAIESARDDLGMSEIEPPLRLDVRGVDIRVQRQVLTQVKGSKLAHDFWRRFDQVYDGQEVIKYDRDGELFKEVVKMLEKGGHYLPKSIPGQINENEINFMKEIKDLGIDSLLKRGPSLPNEIYEYLNKAPSPHICGKALIKWQELGPISIEDMLQRCQLKLEDIERGVGQFPQGQKKNFYFGTLTKDNLRDGIGRVIMSEGEENRVFEGIYVNGDRYYGRFIFKNGDYCEGFFRNGKQNGPGMYHDSSTGITKWGTFKDDTLVS